MSYYEAGRDEIFTFYIAPEKNTQFILVNMHMLWHRRQIWRQLSAGINRHQSNPEERPALTVLSKTKLQDITIGKRLREDRKTESIVRGNGQSWLFRPPGLLHWGDSGSAVKGGKSFTAVMALKTMRRASVWEKHSNLNNEDECRALWLPWISNMSSVLSEGEQWTQLRGRLWVSPHSSLEAWHLAKI